MKVVFRLQNSWPFLAKLLSALLLCASGGYYQLALVNESGMIKTQMGNA
jgi:hypothetical protein